MNDVLRYQTVIYVGAGAFYCVESYESVFSRMRDLAFQIDGSEDEGPGAMKYAQPVELTVKGPQGPLRMAVQPLTLLAVCEVSLDEQEPVDA